MARDAREQSASGELRDILPILNRISLFGGLDDAQLETVVAKLTRVSVAEGGRIFQQGSSPSRIYIVQKGRIKIVVDIDETPLELVEYGIGQCFGETSAIGIQPHSATALAVTDVDLLALSSSALHELFSEDAKLFGMLILNIAREACRRLHRTDELLLHYATRKEHHPSLSADAEERSG